MKKIISNGVVSLWLAAVIIVLMFTACTKKSETQSQTTTEEQTQTAAADKGPYPQILNGDLSAFAGMWVNGYGNRIQLYPNGTLGGGKVNWISLNDSGAYVWGIQNDAETSGTNARLYPAGIEIISEDSQIIQTDTTKVRITTDDMLYSSDEVYYREGEVPAENDSSTGDINGQWRFESGGNINFFGHEFITISPNGHIEIWGIRPGQSYIEGGTYTKETASWEITDGGEMAVYHESGINGAFYFSITERDDVMNITDQNGNSAVFKKVYLQ